MSESKHDALAALWPGARGPIAESRSATDAFGRQTYHHASSMWCVAVARAADGEPYSFEWTDAGCVVDGRLYPWTD